MKWSGVRIGSGAITTCVCGFVGEGFFPGILGQERHPELITEEAIHRTQTNNGSDEWGFVAGFLPPVLGHCVTHMLCIMSRALFTGRFPSTWRKLFRMLLKKLPARIPSDFQPTADIRMMRKKLDALADARVNKAGCTPAGGKKKIWTHTRWDVA